MQVTRVPNGTMAEKNSVFIAFYSDPTHLYQTNPDCRKWGHDAWFAKVSLLATMIRWDGSFGFVGGQVDPGEDLITAALRESCEEIGHTPKPEDLTLICSHHMTGKRLTQHTHLYACKLSVDELYELRMKACSSYHGRVESSGLAIVHMTPDAPKNLRTAAWAGTGKIELDILLNSGIIKPCLIEVNDNPL